MPLSYELSRHPLQAVLLADSFSTNFSPLTLERPKVLMPLVNVPLINYILAWLESAGIQEVLVSCSAHAGQVVEYLENSGWVSRPNFKVFHFKFHYSVVSAGDALRVIYEKNVIHGAFVLISGDTVSNMTLTQALLEHKERRKKDVNAIMTMVIQQSKLSPIIHESRFGTDELIMAIDPATKQLLLYEEKAKHTRGIIPLDNAFLVDNPSLSLCGDKQDYYIDIWAPEVLGLFTDNFDYQHLSGHFVKGLLEDDIMEYKIFTHEIHSSYAAKIDNYRSYDTISKDIILRWTHPFVPDVKFFGDLSIKLEREGTYRDSDIEQSRSAHIGPFTVIGKGAKIGNNSRISNSVIGRGCIIGSNVSIIGSYIRDDVTIEDGCELNQLIVCDGAMIKSGAVLKPGVVLSFKPPMMNDDEELEYTDSNSGTIDSSTTSIEVLNGEISKNQQWHASELGTGGVGYVWSIPEGVHEGEWRYSIAPIPVDNEAAEAMNDDSDDDVEEFRDPCVSFEEEVEATFLRVDYENVKMSYAILEINSVRLAYNKSFADCTGAVFHVMMKLALKRGHSLPGELDQNVASVLNIWRQLLMFFAKEIDNQIEVILKFEEMCLESTEISPHFARILHMLYNKDVLVEDAILRWADGKKDAEESDKVFVRQSESFIQWLRVLKKRIET